MFFVNDRLAEIATLDPGRFPDPGSHRYGVHLTDTEQALMHIIALRDVGAGIFPIHADVPHGKALEMAAQAECDLFLSDDAILPVPGARNQGGGVLIQMSSGTTGAPKVITRSWEAIRAEIATYATTFVEAANMTPVIACPITHSYGLIAGVMVAMQRGHVPVIIDNLNPKYILRRMRELRDPLLYSSPAMLHLLASFLPEGQKLHAAMTSGTVLSKPWFETIRTKTTHLFQQYGCSEVGCIAINPDLRDPAEMGIPLQHLSVTAGVDEPAPIMVDGIATGDLGQLKPDGMLTFVSRQDDVIDVAGLNVYPTDIEHAALAMAGVNDALAFRINDNLAGQRVGLVFDGTASAEGLREWLAQRLAPYQLPSDIHPVSRIPRQENGKINRRDVAHQFFKSEA